MILTARRACNLRLFLTPSYTSVASRGQRLDDLVAQGVHRVVCQVVSCRVGAPPWL